MCVWAMDYEYAKLVKRLQIITVQFKPYTGLSTAPNCSKSSRHNFSFASLVCFRNQDQASPSKANKKIQWRRSNFYCGR